MKNITFAISIMLLGATAAKAQLNTTLKDDKWGYKDRAGNEVVKPKYDMAYDFKEGLGRVKKRDKYGYIDSTGQEIIEVKYQDASDFKEGLADVKFKDKCGFIDKTGTEVITLKYEVAGGFRDGLSYVVLNDKVGYIDHSGVEVIPIKYDEGSSFHEGLACVKVNDKYGYIDKTGKVVIEMTYDKADDFTEGLAAVRKGGWVDGKWGYIDKNGEVVIPFQYDKAKAFRKGRAEVEENRGKFSIDYWGKVVGSDYKPSEIGYKPNARPADKSNAGTGGYDTDFIDEAKKKMARMMEQNRKNAATPKISVVSMADYVQKKDIKGLLEYTKKAGVTGYTEKRSFAEGWGKTRLNKKDSVTYYSSNEGITISEGYYEHLRIDRFTNGSIEVEYPFHWFDMDAVRKELTAAGYSIEFGNCYSKGGQVLRIVLPEKNNLEYPYIVIFRNE